MYSYFYMILKNEMNLIIDLGNTRTKLAFFENTTFISKTITKSKNIYKTVHNFKKDFQVKNCIVSSVSKFDLTEFQKKVRFDKFLELDNHTKIPFNNKYKTPTTLGVDRIALISAAVTKYPAKNVLVIDSGTCVTYDLVNKKNEYFGGAISPGIAMRYKSLHQYTTNLPLLEQSNFELLGKDTNQSIHSGVLNGILSEIDGVICQYKAKYQNLTVVLTGGDTNFLAKNLKSTIFANPNFLLEGLNSILIHNLDE